MTENKISRTPLGLQLAIAPVTVFFASALRMALMPVMHGIAPFLLFFIPVVLSAWFGGAWSALVATILGGVAGSYLRAPEQIGPDFSNPAELARLILFFVESAVIAAVICRLRTSERKSKRDEERYRDLFMNNPQPMWIYNCDTMSILEVNDASIQCYGYSRAEFKSLTIFDLHPAEEIEQLKQTIARRKLGFWEELSRFKQVRKDGSVIDVEIQTHEIKYQGAQARMILVTDITERMKAEVALEAVSKASAAVAQSLDTDETLQAIARAVIPTLGDWCTIDILNDKGNLERLMTYSREPDKAQDCEIMMRESRDFAATSILLDALESGRPQTANATSPEGLKAPAHRASLVGRLGLRSIVVVPMVMRGKTIGLLSIIAADDSRTFDPSSVRLIQEIAHRASFAYENARLYSEAQKANAAKTMFLANMSHEIRTPLGVILGYADIAAESGAGDAELVHSLQAIKKNGEHLLSLVGDILDLSKIESGHMEFEFARFNLPALIEDITSGLIVKARDKNLDLRVDMKDITVTEIESDPVRIKQILVNLVGNAIKFTQQGSITLKVASALRQGEQSGRVSLTFLIQDTGIGISRAQIERLFQPFAQGDSSMNRRFGGSGLGLAIAKRLARDMGGDLILEETKLGEGSRFRCTLEVRRAFGEGLAVKQPTEPVRTLDLAGLRVLLVEDSVDNQAVLAKYLKRVGVEIDCAMNGGEGLKMAFEKPYDLVLMDLQMPVVDGYEATQLLRQRRFERPIIALTAHALQEERDRALKSGFNDYVTKPVNRQVLFEAIAKATDRF